MTADRHARYAYPWPAVRAAEERAIFQGTPRGSSQEVAGSYRSCRWRANIEERNAWCDQDFLV